MNTVTPKSPTQLLAKDASKDPGTKMEDEAAAARKLEAKKPEAAAFNAVNFWGHQGVDESLVPDDA